MAANPDPSMPNWEKAKEVRQTILETILLAQNDKPKSEQWNFHKFYSEGELNDKSCVEVIISGERYKIAVERYF